MVISILAETIPCQTQTKTLLVLKHLCPCMTSQKLNRNTQSVNQCLKDRVLHKWYRRT